MSNPNEINLNFYAGEKAYAVGKKDSWLTIITDSIGLAALGKIEKCIETDTHDHLRMNSGWNNSEQGYARDEIIALALSKYEIDANEVRLTGQEIGQAIENSRTKLAETKKRDAEAKTAREAAEKEKREVEAARRKTLADARELLKDELSKRDKEIEELKAARDSYRKTAQENEEAIRKKLIEDGSFDLEEEHTVTYKVVRDEDC